MDDSTEQTEPQPASPSAEHPRVPQLGPPPTRLPSRRTNIVLAVAMLTIGVVVGAAVGPAPATSLAGDGNIAQKLPALIAAFAARSGSPTASQPAATGTQPPPIEPRARPAASPT